MAEPKYQKFLLDALEAKGDASGWNKYKSGKGEIDLSKVDLRNQDLMQYNFTDVNLAAANLFNADLSGADLSRANLSYANMQRTNLANAFLTNANLKVANLRGANAVDTNFDFADLSHARLNGAWMVGASLAGVNLEGADLRGANLKFANLKDAKLNGANVDETDLTNVELTKEQIASLRFYGRAIIKTAQPVSAAASKKKKIPVEETYEELFTEKDCYKILGVSKYASLEEIEHAYRKRAKEYHPDRVGHLGEKLKFVARREFERIQHAYKSLSRHKAKPAVDLGLIAGEILKQKTARELQIDDYIKLIDENPYSDKLHYNLGLLYFEKGFVEMALEEYKKALQINPYNVYAQHNMRVASLLKVLSGEK